MIRCSVRITLKYKENVKKRNFIVRKIKDNDDGDNENGNDIDDDDGNDNNDDDDDDDDDDNSNDNDEDDIRELRKTFLILMVFFFPRVTSLQF